MNRTEIAALRSQERTGMSNEFSCLSIKIARSRSHSYGSIYERSLLQNPPDGRFSALQADKPTDHAVRLLQVV